ncbi:MAG: glutamate synthase subunit beta [Coriobacteriales bacterium]|jgi:glutamate synthase (NADPH/NADH) small chain|nr:glutamate synthase subunit beta [Coriobacteriales bacterium]
MGKTTGFMEYDRAEAAHRPVRERIGDYDPYLLPSSEADIRTQSARCMDCGVPFCHAALHVAGTSIGCPLGTLIPEINDLAYRGDWEMAYRRLALRHPFPEITGRVCPALCEGSCVEGNYSEPVAIKDIERTLATQGLAQGLSRPRIPAPTGKTVAVVGSGPSGLATANALSLLGHRVRVYEREDRPGGFLLYGIPNMKLEKSIIDARCALLTAQGVEFCCNCEIGTDRSIEQLKAEHDAVVVCIGARQQRRMQVPGSDAQGVYTAIEYLTATTRQLLDGTALAAGLSAEGREVIVVGGGDTGTDCIATAIRQGAANVSALEIMPALPAERAADNPWPLWPRVRKTDYGHEEALEVFGREVREYETTVSEVLQDAGRCIGIVSVQVRWERDGSGRFTPVELPETAATRKADLILTAMGFTGVEPALAAKLGLPTTPRGTFQASEGDALGRGGFATPVPGVFVAGDARRGPSLVVWAFQEGIRAARECDKYLRR